MEENGQQVDLDMTTSQETKKSKICSRLNQELFEDKSRDYLRDQLLKSFFF